MENTKSYQIKKNLRQSKKWAQYLQRLGWGFIDTSNGTKILTKKLPLLGLVCKIQRPEKINKKELDEIDKITKENNIFFIKIEPSLNQDISILKNNNYTKSKKPLLPPTSLIIDLKKNKKTLKNNMHQNARYLIRKANRNGVQVEFIQNPNQKQLRTFYSISNKSSKRNGIYPIKYNWLKNMTKVFGEDTFLIFAKLDEKYVAGHLYLTNTNGVWHMYTGIDKSGRKTNAGYKLAWESIKYFKNKGYHYLDLGGLKDKRFPKHTKNWGGFSYFKKKFGGCVVKHHYPYIKIRSFPLSLLKHFM